MVNLFSNVYFYIDDAIIICAHCQDSLTAQSLDRKSTNVLLQWSVKLCIYVLSPAEGQLLSVEHEVPQNFILDELFVNNEI